MLLIYHGKPEVAEDHIVFEQGMGANYDAYAAVFKSCVDFSPLCRPAAAGKKGCLYTCRGKILRYVLEMLLCKHFRRCHYAGLVSVPDSYQGSEHCYHCLPASDVSLEKTVELVSAAHVVPDFGYDPFLGSCQRKRKGIVAGIERISDLWHPYAYLVAAPYVFLLEQ